VSEPRTELDAAMERARDALIPFADGFVIIARVGNEDGKMDSYRYKVRGPTSEARGLIETVRTYFDEDDRKAWRESQDIA
jgi:hypothetical protein